MIVFFILAVIGFAASVVVHVSTFLDRPPFSMNQTWPLHLGIFLVGIPAMMALRKEDEDEQQQTSRREAPQNLEWMYRILGVCFVYTMVSFLVCMLLMCSGTTWTGKVQSRDGRHVIVENDVVVAEMTDVQYHLFEARGQRAFSGLWMLFYCFSAVSAFDDRHRRAAERARRGPPQLPRVARTSAAYTLDPAPRLSPRAHATLQWVLAIACCAVLTMAVVIPLAEFLESTGAGGWIIVPLAGFAPITTLFLTARLFECLVSARCPSCGGRTICDGLSLRDGRQKTLGTYTCLDCGYECHLGGNE